MAIPLILSLSKDANEIAGNRMTLRFGLAVFRSPQPTTESLANGLSRHRRATR